MSDPTSGSAPDRRSFSVPVRGERQAKRFTSPPIPVDFAGPDHRYVRAILEIDGIAHGGASYEGRVFLNNPDANEATPKNLASGYAGSFHIFGHGGCLGDPGHCEVKASRDPFDFRSPHPLTPAKKRITVTDALKRVARDATQTTVTVVPVVSAKNELTDDVDVFHCTSMRFLTYNA